VTAKTQDAGEGVASAGARLFFVQWLILGMALLILGGIIGYYVNDEYNLLDVRERERLTSHARVLDANIGRQLYATNQALTGIRNDLSNRQATQDGKMAMGRRLQAINAAMPGTRTISVINADGVVAASNRRDLLGRKFADRDSFRTARLRPDQSILYVSPPFKTVFGVFSINLARVVTGPAGEFAGIVVATLDPEYFGDLLESVLYAPDMRASISHGDGKVFMVAPDRKDVEGIDLVKPGSFFTRHIESKRTASLFKGLVRATGEQRMLAMRTIKTDRFATDKPLIVAVSRDLSVMFASWRRKSLEQGMLFATLVLSATFGLYIFQRRERKFIRMQNTYTTAIERSEQKYRDLVENSNSIILRWSRDGKITFLNEFGLKFFGYTEQEIIGRYAVGAIVPKTDSAGTGLEPLMNKILANPEDFEQNINENMRRNGEHVWISWTNKPVLDEQGHALEVLSIGNDITERKQAEDALQASEQQQRQLAYELQVIIDSFPGLIFFKDKENRLLRVNRYLAAAQGVTKDQLEGRSLFDLYPADVAQAYWDDDRGVIQSGKARLNIEEPWDTPEGVKWLLTSKFPFLDKAGSIVGVIGISQDITERKEMEERLRESEERYRNLFQNNHAIQLVIDPDSGNIVDANPAACRYYGYDMGSFSALKITDINTLSDDHVYEDLARAGAEEGDHFYFSHRLANGEIRPVEVYSGPITLMGKRLLYSIVHDISDRKRAEEEKERLILELRDALSNIRTLRGLIPICSSCKKILNDKGYWEQMELYIRDHSEADFSHGICPECAEELYPEFYKKKQ
jgi:PAS domain S-box-containing protein